MHPPWIWLVAGGRDAKSLGMSFSTDFVSEPGVRRGRFARGFGLLSYSLLLVAALAQTPANPEAVLGLPELYRLDRLPAFKSSVEVGSISSYDRTGGNDDGFSGKYSFIREEKEGLVIADLKGPGIIYRIWTPTPSDDWVDFYFDGEASPRIQVQFREMFLGRQAPFVAPLVGYGGGGFYSYVPLPFSRSCKILIRAKRVQFYQVNYALYAPGTPVESFSSMPNPRYLAELAQAQKVFLASGSDLGAQAAPPLTRNELLKNTIRLGAKQTGKLFQIDQPGRIAGLRLYPAAALAGKPRDLVLKISFDGEGPAIWCPAGDFFGYAWGQPAMKSLLIGASQGVAYCYFPMPFDRSARVELVSEREAGQPVEISAELVVNTTPRSALEGKFYAGWRRENPTADGVPFTFIKTRGRGHVVGVILQAQGFESGKTLFFEGDDQATIDGKLVIHGTGSEDFFNGGWYDVPDRWEKRISFPLSGCLGYDKHLGRTGGYRLFLGDAYAYQTSLGLTIEHSGERNNIPTDYCAVTFLYAADRPSDYLALPPAKDRRVNDLQEVVFPAWWQTPIHAWSFNNASLERRAEKVGQEEVRFLSLKATGQDWFGAPFLSLTCEAPSAGAYEILIEAMKGPGQAQVQLFQNEAPVAKAADLYQASRAKSGRVSLGMMELEEGKNNLMLKLPGKNEKAAGLALDLIQIICRKAQ